MNNKYDPRQRTIDELELLNRKIDFQEMYGIPIYLGFNSFYGTVWGMLTGLVCSGVTDEFYGILNDLENFGIAGFFTGLFVGGVKHFSELNALEKRKESLEGKLNDYSVK